MRLLGVPAHSGGWHSSFYFLLTSEKAPFHVWIDKVQEGGWVGKNRRLEATGMLGGKPNGKLQKHGEVWPQQDTRPGASVAVQGQGRKLDLSDVDHTLATSNVQAGYVSSS